MQTSFPSTIPAVQAEHSPPSLREQVRLRTRELVLQAGRQAHEVTLTDYETARREVTGVSDPERQILILDANDRGEPFAASPIEKITFSNHTRRRKVAQIARPKNRPGARARASARRPD